MAKEQMVRPRSVSTHGARMISQGECNIPEVVAEVERVFRVYETALLASDTDGLGSLFLNSNHTVRYGLEDIQYGLDELRAFWVNQKPFQRRLLETRILTFGSDVAIVATLFRRGDTSDKIGRQMQTWLRTQGGWRIAAAHVSMVRESQIADHLALKR